MDSIDFANSFNITLRMQLAPVVKRILAYLLDWLVMLGYGTVAAMFIFVWLPDIVGKLSATTIITLPIVFSLPIVFYHLLCETLFSGQTLGKMLLHIKVTFEDGSPVTFGACLLRWSLLMVDFWVTLPPYFGVIGLISMASSKKIQRLGDRAAGTIVVNTRVETHIELYDSYYRFDKSYMPCYPQAVAMSEAQISFIVSLLIAATGKKTYDRDILAIAGKVLKILQLDKSAVSGITAREFLLRVAKDYNYYALNVA